MTHQFSQTNTLAASLDSIFKISRFSSNILAIPWLHFQRPSHRYRDMYSLQLGSFTPLKLLSEILIVFIGSFRYLVKTIVLSLKALKSIHPTIQPEKYDVLFVSHLTNTSHLDNRDDFYFSCLPNFFQERGFKVCLVFINHTRSTYHSLQPISTARSYPVFIIPATSNLLNYISHASSLCRASLNLLGISLTSTKSLFRCCLSASIRAYSSSSFASLSYQTSISSLLSLFRPSRIFTLYEGHAWERITFKAARTILPSVECCAYQHAAIFPHQHSIYRMLGHHYDPDIIYTSGIHPNLLLESSLFSLTTDPLPKVRVLGSPRYQQSTSSITKASNIVFLPDGTPSEVFSLASLALSCAALIPSHTFSLRLHPVLSKSFVTNTLLQLHSNFPANFLISEDSLEHDTLRARFAVYRGSTSIYNAIMNDCIPLYYPSEDLSIISDPLHYLIGNLNLVIHSPNTLHTYLRDPSSQPSIDTIKNLVAGFYTPFQPSVVLDTSRLI